MEACRKEDSTRTCLRNESITIFYWRFIVSKFQLLFGMAACLLAALLVTETGTLVVCSTLGILANTENTLLSVDCPTRYCCSAMVASTLLSTGGCRRRRGAKTTEQHDRPPTQSGGNSSKSGGATAVHALQFI